MSNYVWPCNGGYVTSKFGPRIPPTKDASSYHNGIDIGGATAILAAKPGKVIYKGYSSARGNYLKIDHGSGVVTLYQHAASFSVSVGSQVSAGQKIGVVGSTGISKGAHLHFEVQVHGTCKNPLNYVSPGNTKYTGPSYGGAGSSAGSGNAVAQQPEKKDITEVVVKSVSGQATVQKVRLTDLPPHLAGGVEILIQHDQIYLPVVEGEVQLEQVRKGAPAKLTFTVLKDGLLNFQEGNPVTLRVQQKPVFAGYVFQKRRSNAVQIEVTAYDQLRYLKNKDTLSYTGKTYGELLQMIAKDRQLTVGEVADTKYKIPTRIEECSWMDMLQNASDLTVVNTGKLYVLYDDFGKLTLKSLEDMILNIVVDEQTAQGYDYSSSIDQDTYTQIKLAVDNDTTGQREIYVLNDPVHQAQWGQLTYYEKLDSQPGSTVLTEKAKVLLDYYNKKQRSLTIKGVFGDTRVRGGSLLAVRMGLGDINVSNYMCVEKVVHHFQPGQHTMDLTLSGIRGEFVT